MQPTAPMMPDAAGGARERNRGAETITTLCGERADSKGKAYGGGRSARALGGAAISNLRGREGVNIDLRDNTYEHENVMCGGRHVDKSQ